MRMKKKKNRERKGFGVGGMVYLISVMFCSGFELLQP